MVSFFNFPPNFPFNHGRRNFHVPRAFEANSIQIKTGLERGDGPLTKVDKSRGVFRREEREVLRYRWTCLYLFREEDLDPRVCPLKTISMLVFW